MFLCALGIPLGNGLQLALPMKINILLEYMAGVIFCSAHKVC